MAYSGSTGGRALNRFLANQGLIQNLDSNQANIAKANIGEINAGVINAVDSIIVDLSAINMNVTNELIGETIVSSTANFTNTSTTTLNAGSLNGINGIIYSLSGTNASFSDINANTSEIQTLQASSLVVNGNIVFTGSISGNIEAEITENINEKLNSNDLDISELNINVGDLSDRILVNEGDIASLQSGKVNKAGDTMTGTLTITKPYAYPTGWRSVLKVGEGLASCVEANDICDNYCPAIGFYGSEENSQRNIYLWTGVDSGNQRNPSSTWTDYTALLGDTFQVRTDLQMAKGNALPGNIIMESQNVKGMGEPVDPSDATTKNYVDSRVQASPYQDYITFRYISTVNGTILPSGNFGNTYNTSGSEWELAEVTLSNTDDESVWRIDLSNDYNEFIDLEVQLYNNNLSATRSSGICLYFYDSSDNNDLSSSIATYSVHQFSSTTNHRLSKKLNKNHNYSYCKIAWRGESTDIRWGWSSDTNSGRKTSINYNIHRWS